MAHQSSSNLRSRVSCLHGGSALEMYSSLSSHKFSAHLEAKATQPTYGPRFDESLSYQPPTNWSQVCLHGQFMTNQNISKWLTIAHFHSFHPMFSHTHATLRHFVQRKWFYFAGQRCLTISPITEHPYTQATPPAGKALRHSLALQRPKRVMTEIMQWLCIYKYIYI